MVLHLSATFLKNLKRARKSTVLIVSSPILNWLMNLMWLGARDATNMDIYSVLTSQVTITAPAEFVAKIVIQPMIHLIIKLAMRLMLPSFLNELKLPSTGSLTT